MCGDALWLGSKGRHGSFHLWINVLVAGKTVCSLVNTCHPERFRDEYRTHYKALYECPICLPFTNLLTYLPLRPNKLPLLLILPSALVSVTDLNDFTTSLCTVWAQEL